MTQEVKISRAKIIGGSLAVFVVAMLLGNMMSGAAEAPETSAESDSRGGIIYKIPVTLSQPAKGPEDALVTIVQWCDFPDEGCLKLEPTLDALLQRYPKELRLVFRHFANQNGPGSQWAHAFSVAAGERAGKFWEARKLLLAHKGEITMANLEAYAGQLQLDWNAIKRDIEANTHAGPVAADRLFAQMFEVKQPPGIFANGRPLVGTLDGKALTELVERELERGKQALAGGVQRRELYAELTKNGVWVSPDRQPQR